MGMAGDAVRADLARRIRDLSDEDAARVLLFIESIEEERRRDVLASMTGTRKLPPTGGGKTWSDIDELRGDIRAQEAEKPGDVWRKLDSAIKSNSRRGR